MKILVELRDDMRCQKQVMAKVQENLQELNENFTQKLEHIELKTKELEEKFEKQQMNLERLEQQLRKRNIIFFGLEEDEKCYTDLEKTILNILNHTMKIACEQRDIELVRRLGKRNGNTRPVALTVTTMGLKIKILRNKKLLQNSNIYLKEDYSPKILQKRKELQDEFLSRREQGESVIMKRDKIISLDNKNPNRNASKPTQSPKLRSNKRKQPSPETLPAKQKNNPNIHKKNKTVIDSYMIPKQAPSTSTASSPQTLPNSVTPHRS